MILEEHQDNILKLIKEYCIKYNQAPTACYYPIALYDDLLLAIKERAYRDNSSFAYGLVTIYHNAMSDHYLALFDVKIYRSIVTEIDFNVPERD